MKHLLLITLLAACLMPGNVAACTCPEGDDGIEAAYDAADLIFTGEALKLRGGYFTVEVHATTFKPSRIFKGISEVNEIAIATLDVPNGCDLTFWEGRRYLVYAHIEKDNLFHASICSRTTFADGAEEEIAQVDRLSTSYVRKMPKKLEGVPDMPANLPKE